MNSYMDYHTSTPKTSFKCKAAFSKGHGEDNVPFPVDFKQVFLLILSYLNATVGIDYEMLQGRQLGILRAILLQALLSPIGGTEEAGMGLPGGSVVKILHLQRRTCEFDPSWENLRYHVPHCQKHKKELPFSAIS